VQELEHDEGSTPITIEWTIGCDRCGTMAETRRAQPSIGGTIRMTHIIACRVCDERIDAVMEALLMYGNHTEDCTQMPCSCRWSELRGVIESSAESVNSGE
jgi:hypothetical protein